MHGTHALARASGQLAPQHACPPAPRLPVRLTPHCSVMEDPNSTTTMRSPRFSFASSPRHCSCPMLPSACISMDRSHHRCTGPTLGYMSGVRLLTCRGRGHAMPGGPRHLQPEQSPPMAALCPASQGRVAASPGHSHARGQIRRGLGICAKKGPGWHAAGQARAAGASRPKGSSGRSQRPTPFKLPAITIALLWPKESTHRAHRPAHTAHTAPRTPPHTTPIPPRGRPEM